MKTIKRGDLVTLKSGSTTMTVQYKDNVGLWLCTYYCETKSEFISDSFIEESLLIQE